MAESLFDVGSLPPWMIQRETPGQALVQGIAAGSQIAHNILAARSFALQQQESITQQQNSMRMREGLVAFGAYMGNVKDWAAPEAEAGAYRLLEQNPWLGQTPAFQAGINNFKTAQEAKRQITSRELIAEKRNAQLLLIDDLKSADKSFDNQAKMDRLRERILMGEDVSEYLLQEKAKLGAFTKATATPIAVQNEIEKARAQAAEFRAAGDEEKATIAETRAKELDLTRQHAGVAEPIVAADKVGTATPVIVDGKKIGNAIWVNRSHVVFRSETNGDLTPAQQASVASRLLNSTYAGSDLRAGSKRMLDQLGFGTNPAPAKTAPVTPTVAPPPESAPVVPAEVPAERIPGTVAPPPAASVAPAPASIPQARTQADIDFAIKEANEAIAAGRDPKLVRERLKQMGIPIKE